MTWVADDSDDIGVERTVAEGCYGEVLDILGDDMVVVDEAPAARCWGAEYPEACSESRGRIGSAVDETGSEAWVHPA